MFRTTRPASDRASSLRAWKIGLRSKDLVEPEPVSVQGAETGPSQIWRAARRLLAQPDFRGVLACSVVLGLAVSFVVPFLSMFGTLEVKMSLGLFGAFMTLTAGVNIALSTALSHWSDTLRGRRGMLLLGSGAGAVGYLGYAITRDIWSLLGIGAVILGVASVTFSQLFAYARELLEQSEIPKGEAPLYMNAFRMSFALAWTVGPALAAETLRRSSFGGLFCGASLLYAVLFVLVLRVVPAGGRLTARVSSQASTRIAPLFANRALLVWFVAFVLVFAAHTMSMSNMSLLVLKVLSGNAAQVGVIFSLAPLFELPFMLYFGLLATRIDSKRLIRAAMALSVVYYLALACVRTPSQIYPLQLLSAAIVSITSGIAITFFQNKLPGQFGAATNLYSNASRIGSTSGYLIFGTVASRFGHRGACVACAALAGLSFLLSNLGTRSARPAQ